MRIPSSSRAARGCAAATLIFSLGLTPSSAGMGGLGGAPSVRPAFGGGHFSHFAPRGFNRRFDFDRFAVHRFGPDRFDRFGANRFGRFGFDRFNRFGGNQLFVGGWGGWGWDGGGGVPASTGASEPIIVSDGAPVIINVGVDPGLGDAGGAYGGGCVIHKLNYDSKGKYVGERQIPQC
jgi:hypothetical protein